MPSDELYAEYGKLIIQAKILQEKIQRIEQKIAQELKENK